jgi:tetratricopeptide (TPR) repeat protein
MRCVSQIMLAFSATFVAVSLAHGGPQGSYGGGAKAPQGQQGQQGQTQEQAQPAGPVISNEEKAAFMAIQNELDPDKAIQLVGDFEKKFPSSTLLSSAYAFASNSAQRKGDLPTAVGYGEKSLKLSPDNVQSLMIMAYILPQPQVLRANEADKEKKLTDAEKYANRALEMLAQPVNPNLVKPATDTDDQFKKRKDNWASGMHSSLGMIHLQRSSMALVPPDHDELAKAEQEYKLAVTMTDRPDAVDYYRLGDAYALDGKTDEGIDAYTKASQIGQGTVIQNYADQRVGQLKAAKKKMEDDKAQAKH